MPKKMVMAALAEFPDFIRNPLRTLAPGERLTCSEWADKYRILDQQSSARPGRWSNEVTPYLKAVMDEMDNPDTEEVIFVKPTQVGATEALLNMLGYFVMQRPAPTLCMYPSEKLAKFTSKVRLQRMLNAAPELREHFLPGESKVDELHMDNMFINLIGAHSAIDAASKNIQHLMLDEVDKFPPATSREADPISLIKERIKTFPNRKTFLTSTPTLKTGQIWTAMEAADCVYHYFVPCPDCGEYIELIFDHITFPKAEEGVSLSERAEYAVYACQMCGAVIRDMHKPAMLRNGEWRAVKGKPGSARVVAYWMNTLYSPFVRWSEIAREWLLSQGDVEKLQNFRNSWLALPWEDVMTHTDADMVLERQTDTPAEIVPDWAELLTGGIDVQQNCVYWTIRAWGEHLTSQNIAHGEALSLEDAAWHMEREYRKQNGLGYLVTLCGVDSGEGKMTDAVYEFCLNHADWAIAVKGSSTTLAGHYRIAVIDRPHNRAHGTQYLQVDGDKYKTIIATRMRRKNGEGSWMVHADCDIEYAEQVTAEEQINLKNGKQKWVPKVSHGDNHYLDTEVYAFAVADLSHVRSLHLMQRDESQPEPPKEGGWIGNVTNWL